MRIKSIFCKHKEKECLTNFNGEYINIVSTFFKTYRSAYQCKCCGKIIFDTELNLDCKTINWRPYEG